MLDGPYRSKLLMNWYIDFLILDKDEEAYI